MSEKQVIVTLEDGFGRVQTSIATSLSAPQLMDKIMEIDEQQATINNYRTSRDKWRTKCHQTKEKLDYWKHKSLELYKLLRKINLSDREWEEFLNIINEKELVGDE